MAQYAFSPIDKKTVQTVFYFWPAAYRERSALPLALNPEWSPTQVIEEEYQMKKMKDRIKSILLKLFSGWSHFRAAPQPATARITIRNRRLTERRGR
jgi:hypothetical protein